MWISPSNPTVITSSLMVLLLLWLQYVMMHLQKPLHQHQFSWLWAPWWQSHSSWAQAWECGRWERLPRSFSSSKLSSSLSAEIDMWLLFIIIIKLKIDLLTCLLFKAAKALPLFLMIFKMFMLKKVKVARGRRFNSTVLKKRFSRQFSECWLNTWFQKRKRAGNYSIVMIRMKTMPSLHW